MASPISWTMDSRRCWMTETVIRSSAMTPPGDAGDRDSLRDCTSFHRGTGKRALPVPFFIWRGVTAASRGTTGAGRDLRLTLDYTRTAHGRRAHENPTATNQRITRGAWDGYYVAPNNLDRTTIAP